ncbi:MAG: serpin family protein [Lachnospiraceae bacterium]|nr:serpin family protein [Lachnospiraceae bacterium]
MKKRFLSMILCGCMLVGMAGCVGEDAMGGDTVTPGKGNEVTNTPVDDLADGDEQKPEELPTETVDLMDGIELMSTEWNDNFPEHPITQFGVPMFQNALNETGIGENVLVSPMSAWTVLCMVEAGAKGETKQQMQEVLAITEGDYLTYAKKFTFLLPNKDNYKVHMANGIWYKNMQSLHVNDYFLQYNKTFFDAAAYKAPFDNSTLQNINDWVSENTNGMIPGILEEIDPTDVIYLVNALSFDARWGTIYSETDIWNDIFTTESGEEKLVSMMHSDENLYLEDENTIGFIKYYDDREYAFVALLPEEGMTMEEYVESLTAEKLRALFNGKMQTEVKVTLPKFSVDYGFNMNNVLQQMGMTDAFSDSAADFSAMATSDSGNIYVGSVDQKCFLAVDEYGTKAGAATAVAMQNKALSLQPVKVVNLNRPFVYLIVECDNFEPMFMGTVMNVEETK